MYVTERRSSYLETKLRALFDYQKFEQNADLQNVIDRVHARYRSSHARMLDDDEADMVAAAGVPDTAMKKQSLFDKEKDDNS